MLLRTCICDVLKVQIIALFQKSLRNYKVARTLSISPKFCEYNLSKFGRRVPRLKVDLLPATQNDLVERTDDQAGLSPEQDR